MNISCPEPNSTASVGSLDTSNLTNTKPRLKKLSACENVQDTSPKSHGQDSADNLVPFEKQEENKADEDLDTFEESNPGNAEPKRKKKQQILRRNFKTALEEEEQYGAIRKKVKVLSDSETKTSSPTLSEKEGGEYNLKTKVNKENKFNLNVDQSKNKTQNALQTSTINQNKETVDKVRIKCNNLSLFYSEDKKDVLFKIEYVDEQTGQNQEKLLTRKQMVESNPLVALYYYENHLQFADVPNFRPKFLQPKK